MKQNERFRLWRDIVWLTQLGFSMVSPLLLCIWGGWQLQHRFGFGPWVMVAAIVLGLGGAASGVAGFARLMLNRAKRSQAPPSFNEHR